MADGWFDGAYESGPEVCRVSNPCLVPKSVLPRGCNAPADNAIPIAAAARATAALVAAVANLERRPACLRNWFLPATTSSSVVIAVDRVRPTPVKMPRSDSWVLASCRASYGDA